MAVFSAFSQLLTVQSILALMGGAFIGMLIGALPGLGATIAIVMMLPLTYVMEPVPAILLLLSIYQSAEYGGSISSIALGIPGTPAAVATVIDGHQMAKNGFPGKSLGYSLISSTVGGVFGALVLMFFTIPISKAALHLAEPEYCLIAILGMLAAASLGTKDVLRSLISMALGMLVSTVGTDVFSGLPRFTMGRIELMEGVQLVALLMGLYSISEVLNIVTSSLHAVPDVSSTKLKVGISFKELKAVSKVIAMGSAIGVVIGITPGLGPPTATWLTYTASKKTSKHPEEFGHGSAEGIAGPEAANNSAVGGALVPLLAMGIPGSATMAVVAGAFIIHGIQPGARLFQNNPELVNCILAGFLLTTVAMFLVGQVLTSLFARALKVPNYFLVPSILILSLVGTYATRSALFDIWVALGLGAIVFFIKKLDFSMPSFTLAFVLSPLIEENLRRALLVSKGSYMVFLTRPVSCILIVGTVLVLGWVFVKKMMAKKKAAA